MHSSDTWTRPTKLAPVLFACTIGCSSASANYVPAVSEHYPPTDPSSVLVNLDACPAGAKIIGSAIAGLSAMYEGWHMSASDAIDQLREKAADAGGHGICEVQFTEGSGAVVVGNMGMAASGIQRAQCKVFMRVAKSDVTPAPAPVPAGTGAQQADKPQVEDTLDTVLLANGGRLRGVIFDEDPRAGVGIKLPDGTTRKVKPADVKKVLYHNSR